MRIILVFCSMLALSAQAKINVLVLTTDDMNCDSVGAFGCSVKNTTPNMDRFSKDAFRFMQAHVHASSCIPSRNVVQTGKYLFNSGVEGFYAVPKEEVTYKTTPEILREHGYFTIIRGKAKHSSPYYPYPAWDISYDEILRKERVNIRHPKSFYDYTKKGIEAAQEAGKPFYYSIDIHDPHTALYHFQNKKKNYADAPNGPDRKNPPSYIFKPDEVIVPAFLPDTPLSLREITAYYNSVRRADDSFGQVIKALKDTGTYDDTLIIFFSDHGMPFPFAKTALYYHSTHTPLMIRWPGVTKGGSKDDMHMVGTVDIFPTILDILGIKYKDNFDGRTLTKLLRDRKEAGRDFVFTMYEENVGGNRQPTRSLISKQFGYIVNLWSDGTRKFATATKGMATYVEMERLVKEGDAHWQKRIELFQHRVPEEFFNYENDPDALHNLIDDPKYKKEVERFRREMVRVMKECDDPFQQIYRDRNDEKKVQAYLKKLDEESKIRKRDKRYSRSGKVKASKKKRK